MNVTELYEVRSSDYLEWGNGLEFQYQCTWVCTNLVQFILISHRPDAYPIDVPGLVSRSPFYRFRLAPPFRSLCGIHGQRLVTTGVCHLDQARPRASEEPLIRAPRPCVHSHPRWHVLCVMLPGRWRVSAPEGSASAKANVPHCAGVFFRSGSFFRRLQRAVRRALQFNRTVNLMAWSEKWA